MLSMDRAAVTMVEGVEDPRRDGDDRVEGDGLDVGGGSVGCCADCLGSGEAEEDGIGRDVHLLAVVQDARLDGERGGVFVFPDEAGKGGGVGGKRLVVEGVKVVDDGEEPGCAGCNGEDGDAVEDAEVLKASGVAGVGVVEGEDGGGVL
eukprot:4531922-Ditylum_brightwellii.AAC.1